MLKRLIGVYALVGLAHCSSPTPPVRSARSEPSSSIELTYLGVAGWQLEHQGHVLLLDPYFTRAAVEDNEQPLEPDLAAIDRFAPRRADIVLVGHSHYDHLLDVPAIAERTHAVVVGSSSTLNVARAAGVASDHLRLTEFGKPLTLSGFSITPLESLHSLIGLPSASIPADLHLPLAAKDYAEGGTLAYHVEVGGRSIVFFDTANFMEQSLTGLHPDVAVIATGLRDKIPDYACRLLRALHNPKLVLTTHFDLHEEPLQQRAIPLTDARRADLAKFTDEVHACSPATRVVVPEGFRPMRL